MLPTAVGANHSRFGKRIGSEAVRIQIDQNRESVRLIQTRSRGSVGRVYASYRQGREGQSGECTPHTDKVARVSRESVRLIQTRSRGSVVRVYKGPAGVGNVYGGLYNDQRDLMPE